MQHSNSEEIKPLWVNQQIERMAEAIETEALAMGKENFSPESARPKTERLAQAAYDASDARFVPVLVEALKYYREQEWLGGEDGVAAQALAQLPEEYKQ